MEKLEALFVDARKIHVNAKDGKPERDLFILTGILYDNFGHLTGKDVFVPDMDTFSKYSGPGIYKISYGPGGSIFELKKTKEITI